MDATRQLQAARKFVEHWTFRRGSEKGEDQQFWNALLGSVLGMDDVVSRVQYQVPVRMKDTTKFLDDLTRRVNAAIAKGERRALFALQDEMASLTFLDPACGSGNFLTETYICLRRLENPELEQSTLPWYGTLCDEIAAALHSLTPDP